MSAPFENQRVLTPTGLGFDLWTRPVLCDETVVEEVILRDAYRLRGLALDGAVVIDGGAHVGVFSTFVAMLGAKRVLAVEPQPENLLLLRMNVVLFPTQIEVIPWAIGAEAGMTSIVGESGGTHHEPAHPDSIEVAQITLEQLILEATRPAADTRVHLLKMDMEGGEVDAILACPPASLGKVDRIVMETHGPGICPWVKAPRVDELVEHLVATHDVETVGSPEQLGYLFANRKEER